MNFEMLTFPREMIRAVHRWLLGDMAFFWDTIECEPNTGLKIASD